MTHQTDNELNDDTNGNPKTNEFIDTVHFLEESTMISNNTIMVTEHGHTMLYNSYPGS